MIGYDVTLSTRLGRLRTSLKSYYLSSYLQQNSVVNQNVEIYWFYHQTGIVVRVYTSLETRRSGYTWKDLVVLLLSDGDWM